MSLPPVFGPLLQQAMSAFTLDPQPQPMGLVRFIVESEPEGAREPVLPVALSISPVRPIPGEGWKHYKERVLNTLGPVREWLESNAGLAVSELISGNALQARALTGQLHEAAKLEDLNLIELDPPHIVTAMDDMADDVEMPVFRTNWPDLDGSGVRVAVVDSGIDTLHPWLNVSDSVSTCGESVDRPGPHGTHVAGCLASRDSVYRGIAPGVTLINVKATDAYGRGQPTFIVSGIDAALDREAHIINVSIGFNHLPTWSQGGHGWPCSDGRCQLCLAVNNAVVTDGRIVIVAAGNEHDRAEHLRSLNSGNRFDTEIACPGASDAAITVGSITKRTFLTSPTSSRGPTAFGTTKPDIAAPGVNVTSALPARRDDLGMVLPNLTRLELSTRSSGTSMATPIISGIAALILQRRMQAGGDTSHASIRSELLSKAARSLSGAANEVGVGRATLGLL